MLFGLTLTFLISQIFAGIAMISDILSFQFKERKKILIFFIISSFCIALQYVFLERYIPACISFLAVVRFFVSYHSTNKKWLLMFIPASIGITLIFFKDHWDFLILLASILATLSVFQKNDKYLRLIMMGATNCFLLYNFIIFTPVGILLESIFLGSNLVGYYRYYIKKQIQPIS